MALNDLSIGNLSVYAFLKLRKQYFSVIIIFNKCHYKLSAELNTVSSYMSVQKEMFTDR